MSDVPKKPKKNPSKTESKPRKIEAMLQDPSTPIEMRLDIMRHLVQSEDEAAPEILSRLLENASAATGEDRYGEKINELSQLIEAMQQAPLRCALFDCMLDHPSGIRRAQVILPDGTLASTLVPDEALAEKMRRGDNVWIDGKGVATLLHTSAQPGVGEEAKLERVLPNGNVSISLGELGRAVYRPSARLGEQIEAGEVEAGATLIVCPRRMMAFIALPEFDGVSHFEFLSHEPVPDVVVERDLGAPPAFIRQLTDHLRRELAEPGLSERYRLRRSKLNLLSGIPGSGKTFGINGLWNEMYRILSEVIGVPVADLPPRVMRLKSSALLSKWLGDSDKRIARFFAELDQLAAETFEAPDGTKWQLPLLVIAEEIDALARARGEDGIHDRILASLLEGLDPGRDVYRDRLVFLIATTNTSHLVDMAVIRRIGGRIETFGQMTRLDFRAVLNKLSRALPFATMGSQSESESRECTIGDATAWLYGPNSSAAGQVEITFVGQANPVTKQHRDFLTAGLIDRAMQQASEDAANAEYAGTGEFGLTTELVTNAIHQQVRHIVDLLTPHNCGQYLALPDGERVATVRRIRQPSVTPFALERAS